MFRPQIPPPPLEYAVAMLMKALEDRFGQPAVLEMNVREFIALLEQEIGHPATILTRGRFTRAAERALTNLLARKAVTKQEKLS